MRRVLAVSIFLATAGAALGQSAPITWQADAFDVNGNACTKNVDTFVLAAGDDVSVVFTQLGVSLPGNSHKPLDFHRRCVVRVPATVQLGTFMAGISQTLTYGAVKTTGADAAVHVETLFFHQALSNFDLNLAQGQAVDVAQTSVGRSDAFGRGDAPSKNWCDKQRTRDGFFKAKLEVTGHRNSDTESLIVFVDGLDLKFEVQPTPSNC